MKLMMVCPTCNGKGEITVKSGGTVMCGTCHGKAVVEPSAQILDDLECAEIERVYTKLGYMIIYYENKEGVCELGLKFGCSTKYFTDTSKISVYRKAKEWLDGRGAE